MSYIAYLNGQRLILSEIRPIAHTKQVNDLASLDNRQSNFTNRIVVPFNAVNNRIMQNLSMVGNQSNVPYQKNIFDLIDADSGKHLIYKGWANITKTSNGYELNCYDGLIDFYRSIENKNISEIGVPELNHLKNMDNVIDTFINDDLMYKYIIADYNGKSLIDGRINIDYLVPSARKSYIWERIHQFANFTFSGEVFNSEKWKNNWLTYPKPIPTSEPSLINISTQDSELMADGNDFFYSFLLLNFFPNNFNTAYANNLGPDNEINITTSGVYKLQMNGTSSVVNYNIYNSGLILQSSGQINPTINESVYLNLESGDKLILSSIDVYPTSQAYSTFSYVEGYYANFDEVLIDFQPKDFINELMVEFGLTAYKEKYSNHIYYKSLDEVLQDVNVIDWSDNFLGVKNENYTIGKYAKLNKFKYKYNDENLKYNDGAIKINNENLPDETIVITSKFYTPDRPIGTFFSGLSSNIYKIWDRELKDDSSIEYKELSGRFYCLRYKEIIGSFLLTSESLGTNATVTKLPYESYFRLSWNHLIIDNYKSIESIFDKAKAKELLMNLSFQDYEAFNMDKLIYIDKRASYYLVNKIKSFVKGQPTNVEVFEVDYLKEIEKNEPTERYIIITGVTQDACEVTFTIDTNIPQPVEVKLIPHTFTPDGIGGFFYAPYGDPITVTLDSNQIVHTFTELPEQFFGGYKFKVRYDEGIFQLFESNLSELINIPGSCYITPPGLLTYILITNVQTIAILNNGTTRRIRVDYTSDLSIATILLRMYTTNLQFFSGLPIVTENYFAPPSGSFEVEVPHLNFGVLASYSLQIKNAQFNVNSNIATS